MNMPAAVTAKGKDKDRVVDAIVLAFARDPVMRWGYPEPHGYLEHFKSFAKVSCGRAFEHDSAHQISDFSGAAVWLPPGVELDQDAMVGQLERTLDGQRLKVVFAMLEQMGRYHPAEPHWYLWMIGVDPAKQGRGYGKALLRYALNRIDQQGIPAYLENSNPANTGLYEQHGFQVLGTVQVADAPPVLPMLRPSRSSA
jgi:ribosomal protein S18 acetylase RimI-like enzyme